MAVLVPGITRPVFQAKIPRRDPRLDLHVHRFERLSREYSALHRHPEYEIAVCPFDRGAYMVEHREYRIEPGDVFIIDANDFHQPILDSDRNRGAIVAYLGANAVGGDGEAGDWSVPFMLAGYLEQNRLGSLPRVCELMVELHEAYTSEHLHWEAVCRGILAHMLALIAQRHVQLTDGRHGNRRLGQIRCFAEVLKFINDHLDEDIEGGRLYRIAGLSRSQFCSRFKSAFGVTAATYIQRRRINRAARLLRSSELSVTEICHLCGFNWLSYFNTAFRRYTGMSPTAFRERGRPENPREVVG